MSALDAVRWLWAQFVGFWMNVYDYFRNFALDDVIPPSIRDFANWVISIIPRAFGVRDTTPRQQINANIVLIVATLISALGTLGTTLFILALWVPLLFVGIWRWMPAFNELWTDFRDRLPVKDDYDLPFWRSE